MLKNNKAPEENNINAELIKISTPETVSKIHGIIKESWKNGMILQEWKTSTTCPIYKIGDPMNTNNYKGQRSLIRVIKIFQLFHIDYKNIQMT